MENRGKIGIVGLGVDVMTGSLLNTLPHTGLYVTFIIGAIMALWGLGPLMGDALRPKGYQSKGHNMLPIITMLFGVLIFIAGFLWYYIQTPQAKKTDAIQTSSNPKLTLEAINRSKINASGAMIPGDLPFQFAKADSDSIIHMPGIRVTKKEDGSILVEPGNIGSEENN